MTEYQRTIDQQLEITSPFGGHTMVAPLRRVIVKRPAEAFQSTDRIDAQWRALGYTEPPDLSRAAIEHERFVALVTSLGAEVLYLPSDSRAGLDSVYTHDPALITNSGMVIFQTGKVARRGEGRALADALKGWGVPVFAWIDGDATAEGGDLVWLDPHMLLAGRGFRTNAAGVEALRRILAPLQVQVIEVQLPYWQGPDECLHLMSFISMLDDDLAVIYPKMMPVALYELLEERGIEMIEIPEAELMSQGCNVLAVAPRQIVMLAGNPITRSRLEAAGCTVREFEGAEISIKGAGGPTCLTRPILRS
jgi:N-dimethylarginine dimethylaminohydrolase